VAETHKDDISSIPKLLELNLEETPRMRTDFRDNDGQDVLDGRSKSQDAAGLARSLNIFFTLIKSLYKDYI